MITYFVSIFKIEKSPLFGFSSRTNAGVRSGDNDEKCKPTSITAKLCITSLNSHFTLKKPGTKCGG